MNTIKSAHTALVIGGSGQIGRIVVKHFIGAGWNVACAARGQTPPPRYTQEDGVLTFHTDVCDEKKVHDLMSQVQESFGTIDVLVYAAGLEPDPDCPIATYPLSSWEQTYRTYVTGVFICMKEALQRTAGIGHLIVLSSAVTRFPEGALPALYVGHYASAKAALNELCKWARREFHERGILLSRIAPAAVDVPYHQNAPQYRKPKKLVPLDLLASRILNATLNHVEVDEEMF